MYDPCESGLLLCTSKMQSGTEYCKPDLVNSRYVFQDKCETFKDHIRPFCKFISARLVTMVIEVGGVWLLVEVCKMNDMAGKFITQFIVLALNYIFSKFFVFTTGKSKKSDLTD